MIGKYNKEKEIQTFLRIGKLPPATATMFLYFPPPVNYLPLSQCFVGLMLRRSHYCFSSSYTAQVV